MDHQPFEPDHPQKSTGLKDGGAEGSRTPDPHNAIVVLYQLSYDPTQKREKSSSPS